MNNITTFEVLIIILILLGQIYATYKTQIDIKNLKNLIPSYKDFKLKTEFKEKVIDDENENSEESETNAIESVDEEFSVFNKIINSINLYLANNQGAATDFNLIKDITNRNLDIEDDNAAQNLSLPLYIGLIATIIGIILGLWNIHNTSINDEFQVSEFLVNVGLAMVASLFGVFFTILNTNYSYKHAIKELDQRKNDFFTFTQITLLPVINKSISSEVYDLHQNLNEFNQHFTENLDRLSVLLDKNHDAIIAQDRVLTALDNIDISAYAKANVTVLKELKESTKYLSQFNVYLNQLKKTTDNTSTLSDSFQSLLQRTNNFEGLAEKLDTGINQFNTVSEYLTTHIGIVDLVGDATAAVTDKVTDALAKSFGNLENSSTSLLNKVEKSIQDKHNAIDLAYSELENFTTKKIANIKALEEKGEADFLQAIHDNKGPISNLAYIKDLHENVTLIKGLKEQNQKEILEELSPLSNLNELGKIQGTLDDTHESLKRFENKQSSSLKTLAEGNTLIDQKVKDISQKIGVSSKKRTYNGGGQKQNKNWFSRKWSKLLHKNK